jgi:3-deoxy-D-manno-octulosonic acid (KDO) 8-phosphate synthase
MQELYKKIELIFKAKFPDAEIRKEILDKAGQAILLETMGKTFQHIKDETKIKILSDLVLEGKIEEAFDFAEGEGVKMEEIFEEVSKSVVVDLFS